MPADGSSGLLVDVAIAIGVNDLGETEWMLPDGTITATTCSFCDKPYEPVNKLQKCCGDSRCQRLLEGRTPIPKASVRCSQCGKTFRPRALNQVACSRRCKDARAWKVRKADTAYIESRKAKRRVVPPTTPPAVPVPVAETPIEPAFLGPDRAPRFSSHLPGAAMELAFNPPFRLGMDSVRSIHAVVTGAIDKPHHPNDPGFTLIHTRLSRSQWGVYVANGDDARAIAAKTHEGPYFFGQPCTVRFVALHHIRAPHVEDGEHAIRIDTITPVVVHTYLGTGVKTTQKRPDAWGLTSAVVSTATRLGLTVKREDVGDIEVLDADTTPESTDVPKLYTVTGWTGSVTIRCGAFARWVLEAAAVIGLGARVAFGFGRIVVRGVNEALTDEPIGPSPTLREKCPELFYELDQTQRDILEIFAEAQQIHRRGPRTGGAAGRFFVGPHAVKRFRERIDPGCSYEAALETCIEMSEAARHVGPAKPDPDTGDPRELWEVDSNVGVIRFVVGHRYASMGLPAMVTVLPLDGDAVD